MSEKTFIVTDKTKPNDPMYRNIRGCTYNESDLRAWANDRWGTSEEATLNDIARDIAQGGWMLFELVQPSSPGIEKSQMDRVAEAFQGDLEVAADDIVEAFRTGLAQFVTAKTEIAEVRNNQATVTVTINMKTMEEEQ